MAILTLNDKKIESLIRKAILKFSLIDQNDCVAVALSGGKDSLCLLHMLHKINGFGIAKFNLHAIHIQNELTLKNDPSNLLKTICNELNIPLHIQKVPLPKNSFSCYTCTRVRRTKLFEIAKTIGANKIAFGHHRDDNAQTLLMNMLHKSEFAGMLPKVYMHDYNNTIIRPLIYVAEKNIITYADCHHFLTSSCSCSFGENTKRKQTEKLIQEMEKLYPNARKHLSNISLNYGLNKALKK
ncbi:MAG TPA: ATP-binding protein [Chlamydiales bacterium]|nr:ATP-binding protein [Chlamydiales bacterium]